VKAVKALLVDLTPARRRAVLEALRDAGWSVHAEAVTGADGLEAALGRRGWDAVIHGGDPPGAVPARKALALARLADPHLPVIAVSPAVRPHGLAAVVQGLEGEVRLARDPSRVPAALARELAGARRRGEGGKARRLLLAQQAITDHVAAGLAPGPLLARVLATLGETLGWTFGAVWRPEGDVLACAATWHAEGAAAEVAAFAGCSARTTLAPGAGLPGRVFAFRRPQWAADVRREAGDPRARDAARAGLGSAVAFPIALAEDCMGVVELCAAGLRRPDAELSALFAAVGGQLAQCLERARLQADERARTAALLREERDRAERYLAAARTPILVLDREGRVQRLNRHGTELLGWTEDELRGRDWFARILPAPERAAVRAAFAAAAGPVEHVVLARDGEALTLEWHLEVLRDAAGAPTGVLAAGEDVTARRRAER